MSWLDHLETGEKTSEQSEHQIPEEIAQEAKSIVDEVFETIGPEELSADLILGDLWIGKESQEGKYLDKAIAGLNKKMGTYNSEMESTLNKLPAYVKNTATRHVDMQWDGKNKHLTVLSQGIEVMKFEIWVEPTSVGWLWIYMKDLFAPQQDVQENDVDPHVFMLFATTTELDTERWIATFSHKFTPIDGKNKTNYMERYMLQKNKVLKNTQPNSKTLLLPQESMKLASTWFNAKGITINTLFTKPKPLEIQITYPKWGVVTAILQDGQYLTTDKQRPIIWNGCIIEHVAPSADELQTQIEKNVLWKTYTKEDLFPEFSQLSLEYQQAIEEYVQLFDGGGVTLQTNETGLCTFVDIDTDGYVLHHDVDNAYWNRAYNKNLSLHLDGVMQRGTEGFVFNETVFKSKLKDEIFAIITKNFLKRDLVNNSVALTYTRKKTQQQIRARDKKYYISETWITLCSTATQQSAKRNFWLILPSGDAKASFRHVETPRGCTLPTYQEELFEQNSLTDLWAIGMYWLLSKYLHTWCTVVDIWYESTGSKNGEIYGHRNLAYYNTSTKEWYILDPVWNFWGAARPTPIRLRDALSTNLRPKYMRYYNSPIGVG